MNPTNISKQSVNSFVEDFPEFIVFDLETSGFSSKIERILEVGAIRFKMINGEMKQIGHRNIYIRPEFSINPKIVELTGITNAFLMGQPYEDEVFAKIQEYFCDTPVVGYNSASFDQRFMDALYKRNGAKFSPVMHLDLLPVAKELYPNMEKHKLGIMAAALNEDKGIVFHNALGDALVTARLMRSFLKTEKTIFSRRLTG